jgi:hypothetical protein
MLGKEFCKKVNEYLESIGEETQGVGIIQRWERWFHLKP